MHTSRTITAIFMAFISSVSIHAVTETDASSDVLDNFDANICVDNTDLLHNRPIVSTVTPDVGSWITGINDGARPTRGNDASATTIFASGRIGHALESNPQVTIKLNTAASPSGYHLTSITSINGWTPYDQSLADQKYTVSYSTVSAPARFIPLAKVDYHPFSYYKTDSRNQEKPASSQVTLTDLGAVSGVACLRFTFSVSSGTSGTDPQEGQCIREIQAFGTPTGPVSSSGSTASIDIPPMTWNATGRSDWINVVTDYKADPTGKTDSTAAIQAALDVLNKTPYGRRKTIYFPAGVYKITQTLKLANVAGYQLIGCGIKTVLKWEGDIGAAMISTDSVSACRYLGFVWDGNNRAGCAYEDFSVHGGYGTRIRHENESFRNFNVEGTYMAGRTYPAAAIMSGYDKAQVTGECIISNCCFYNCGTGIYNAVDTYQNYMWLIDGCEFENNQVGFNGGNGGCYILTNTHFQHDYFADLVSGYNLWGQRLTSSGSGQFYVERGSRAVLEDCAVSGWTNPGAAVTFSAGGQDTLMDCTFTNPPSGAAAPVRLNGTSEHPVDLLSSNNSAGSSPSLFQETGTNHVVAVPSGARSRNITSAARTFLKSDAIADSAHIIDVTAPPYKADPTFKSDSTAAFQAAIDAARQAHDGTIVYVPNGLYRISSTLKAAGGDYTIEGAGAQAQICWYAGSQGTMMTIDSPKNISIQYLHFSCLNNIPGNPGYMPTFLDIPAPTCDATTITGIRETAAGASNIVYDNFIYDSYDFRNVGASGDNANGPGLVLSDLPAGSKVYIPVLESPLTVIDCGPAQILSRMAYYGTINVSGATHPKTGFLGMVVAEGMQQVVGKYNFNIHDNQDLVLGSYYSEQGRNDVDLQRGTGTVPGHVTIMGMNSASGRNGDPGGLNASCLTVNIDNYAGRLFYGETYICNDGSVYPVKIVQAGANPIDLMFACNYFVQEGMPDIVTGKGARLIMTLNTHGLLHDVTDMTDTPNPLTPSDLTAISHALDDLRQLGAVDLAVQFR